MPIDNHLCYLLSCIDDFGIDISFFEVLNLSSAIVNVKYESIYESRYVIKELRLDIRYLYCGSVDGQGTVMRISDAKYCSRRFRSSKKLAMENERRMRKCDRLLLIITMSEAPATEKSAILTVEAPANLDLESYIANYRG